MKHRMIQMALLVATAAAGSLASAQSVPDLRVNIPFEFHAAGQSLPAGVYFVTIDGNYRQVDMHSINGHKIFLTAKPGDDAVRDRSSLVFHRYGDTYFLHEIRSVRRPFAGRVPVSKEEKSFNNVAGLLPVVEVVSAGSR
ncbi:MAG: hypothetical protein ABI693_17995 [Bryobacteraceae bacterium]